MVDIINPEEDGDEDSHSHEKDIEMNDEDY